MQGLRIALPPPSLLHLSIPSSCCICSFRFKSPIKCTGRFSNTVVVLPSLSFRQLLLSRPHPGQFLKTQRSQNLEPVVVTDQSHKSQRHDAFFPCEVAGLHTPGSFTPLFRQLIILQPLRCESRLSHGSRLPPIPAVALPHLLGHPATSGLLDQSLVVESRTLAPLVSMDLSTSQSRCPDGSRMVPIWL